MGSDSDRLRANGCLFNGIMPNKTESLNRVLDGERWKRAQERTAELIARIQPDKPSWKTRNAIASCVRRLITESIPCVISIYGSVPLKTYLPDGDIDLTVFSEDQNLNDNCAAEVSNILEKARTDADAEYQIKEVLLIPVEVLYRFLTFFSSFDWDNFCISLQGPVPIRSLPDMTADPPRKDGGALFLRKTFLDTCRFYYSVCPSTPEFMEKFSAKHLYVIDFLRINNNLGRSVSRGNSFRIHSAFTFGAKRLAGMLDCQLEEVVTEFDRFFANTWELSTRLRRPSGFVNWRHSEKSKEVDGSNEYRGRKQDPTSAQAIACCHSEDRKQYDPLDDRFWKAFRIDHKPVIDHTQHQSQSLRNAFQHYPHKINGSKEDDRFWNTETAALPSEAIFTCPATNFRFFTPDWVPAKPAVPCDATHVNLSCTRSFDSSSHSCNMLYSTSSQKSANNYTVLPEPAEMPSSIHNPNHWPSCQMNSLCPEARKPDEEWSGGGAICLPQDVIELILVRLPIKSILQCKSTCKTWYALIRSSSFVDFHRQFRLQHHHDDHRDELFFYEPSAALNSHVCTRDPSSQSDSGPLFDVGIVMKAVRSDTPAAEVRIMLSRFGINLIPDLRVFEHNLIVLGPLINGIYCVVHRNYVTTVNSINCGYFNAAICNPATREFSLISPPHVFELDHGWPFHRSFEVYKPFGPRSSAEYTSKVTHHYGFLCIHAKGSSHVVMDYKMLLIIQHDVHVAVAVHVDHVDDFVVDEEEEERSLVFIYSRQRGTWKQSSGCRPLPTITQDLDFLPQAALNGCCHWMTDGGSILQFDMTDELFQLLPGPPNDYQNRPAGLVKKPGVFVLEGPTRCHGPQLQVLFHFLL
ncbi:hypothetical protein V2J09_005948 [Rumex salicifolius]